MTRRWSPATNYAIYKNGAKERRPARQEPNASRRNTTEREGSWPEPCLRCVYGWLRGAWPTVTGRTHVVDVRSFVVAGQLATLRVFTLCYALTINPGQAICR